MNFEKKNTNKQEMLNIVQIEITNLIYFLILFNYRINICKNKKWKKPYKNPLMN